MNYTNRKVLEGPSHNFYIREVLRGLSPFTRLVERSSEIQFMEYTNSPPHEFSWKGGVRGFTSRKVEY